MKTWNEEKQRIEIPCRNGLLCAQAGGDPSFPELFTYLETKDGSQINLTLTAADLPEQEKGPHYGGIHACLYGDVTREDWTRRYLFTEKELSQGGQTDDTDTGK